MGTARVERSVLSLDDSHPDVVSVGETGTLTALSSTFEFLPRGLVVDFPCNGAASLCIAAHTGEVAFSGQYFSAAGPLVCSDNQDQVCDADECASSPCDNGGGCVEVAAPGGANARPTFKSASWRCDCVNAHGGTSPPLYRGATTPATSSAGSATWMNTVGSCASAPLTCCGSDMHGCAGCVQSPKCQIDDRFWKSCKAGCACVMYDPNAPGPDPERNKGCCDRCDTGCESQFPDLS